MSSLSTVLETPSLRAATAGSLLVVEYLGPTALADLERMDAVQSELAAKFQRISVLSLIGQLGSITRVEAPVRERSSQMLTKYEHITRGGAIVITTRGLAGVMVRTFMSSLFLINSTQLPMRTFSRADEALQWLQGLEGQDAGVKTLTPADVSAWLKR